MIELTIHGRGGQGGVTLAKLIASAYFLKDKDVQAFGVYAAERSGAPLQAYVRIDDHEITNHNQIHTPDHVIVLDRTLIGPGVAAEAKPDGWLILNTSEPPAHFAELFPGRAVAAINATDIAVANGLGTRAVPIVNTTMFGAVGRALGLTLAEVEAALAEVHFTGANVAAARQAYEGVRADRLPGKLIVSAEAAPAGRAASILDPDVGGPPTIRTGTWSTRQPARRTLTPPCNDGCPAGNNIAGFIQALARRDADAALAILLETSPFPGACGRVCPAPCMEACNRAQFDEGVNIRELERYAADRGRLPTPIPPTREQRVAVVGSGPAGLSAAYHLARLGYPVTLFEAGTEPGGVMRTGIPAYRLPREVLDREIDFILRHGLELKTNHRVERRELVKLSHRYAAVFVATGLQELRALNMDDLAPNLVVQGIDFLDRVRGEGVSLRGSRVVVVGGGNTAMDAARSALRIGAESVRVVYRRTRAEMPAIAEEIDEALEEGIALDELVAPLRLRKNGGNAVLTCQRMKLGEPDASGRPRPVPMEGPEALFDVECDRVILALGQSADLSILPEGSQVHDGETLVGLTGAPVFAGGDFATNEGTVTAAIGSGRRAALHIHRTLTGEDLFPAEPAPVARGENIVMHVFAHGPRRRGRTASPEARRGTFQEVRLGLLDGADDSPALVEAERCFSCGVCNHCDRCLSYCPEGILRRQGDGYAFDYDYCKGCGICAAQCPRGVIYMAEL